MLKYYQTVFHKRELCENESLHAYTFDLKVLASKAYPNINLYNLENIIIFQLVKGLGISAWSKHVLYHCPNSIEEAIDIALGREIFSGCYSFGQNHKYNVLDQTPFLQTNKTGCYKLNTYNTKFHRSKIVSEYDQEIPQSIIRKIMTQITSVRLTQHIYCLVFAMSSNSYNHLFLQNNIMTVI